VKIVERSGCTVCGVEMGGIWEAESLWFLDETWGSILIEKNPGAELRAESRAHSPF